MRSRLRYQALSSLSLQAISLALLTFTAIFVSRLLGPEQYGIYAAVLAAGGLLSIPTAGTVPIIMVRARARFLTGDHTVDMLSLYRFATLTLIVGAVIGIGSWFVYFDEALNSETRSLLGLAALLAILVALSVDAVRSSAMLAAGLVIPSQLPELLIRPVLFLILLFATTSSAAQDALLAYGSAAIVSSAAGVVLFFSKAAPGEFRGTKQSARQWLRPAVTLGSLGALQRAMGTLDVLVLAAFSSLAATGEYRVALQFMIVVGAAQGALAPVLSANLGRYFAEGDHERVRRLTHRIGLLLLAISSVAVLAIAGLGAKIISYAFGADYTAAAGVATVLALGPVVNAATGPTLSLLTLSGNERSALMSNGVGLGLLTILGPYLAHAYGGIGMASAVVVGQAISNTLMAWRVKQVLGFDPTCLAYLRGRG